MRLLAGLMTASLILIGWSGRLASSGADDYEPAENQVFFFEEGNYKGEWLDYECGKSIPDLSQVKLFNSRDDWNNRISSVKLGKNSVVILFENPDFKGESITLRGAGSRGPGHYPTMPPGWDDKASSLKVIQRNISKPMWDQGRTLELNQEASEFDQPAQTNGGKF